MRIMALDVGDKRIGVAISDPEGLIAQSLTVLERKGKAHDLEALRNLAREHQVERILIGLPRRLDGTLGPQAEKAQALGEEIGDRLRLPVVYWDERLTTAQAGVKREARKKRIDAVAATLLLQNYLDFLMRQAKRQ